MRQLGWWDMGNSRACWGSWRLHSVSTAKTATPVVCFCRSPQFRQVPCRQTCLTCQTCQRPQQPPESAGRPTVGMWKGPMPRARPTRVANLALSRRGNPRWTPSELPEPRCPLHHLVLSCLSCHSIRGVADTTPLHVLSSPAGPAAARVSCTIGQWPDGPSATKSLNPVPFCSVGSGGGQGRAGGPDACQGPAAIGIAETNPAVEASHNRQAHHSPR